MRDDIPITINTQCLSHTSNGQEAQLKLNLFKVACLAYKPSDINYRNNTVDRNSMIQLRRDLVDKITSTIYACPLWSEAVIYPKRYFDDLMIQHGYDVEKKMLEA